MCRMSHLNKNEKWYGFKGNEKLNSISMLEESLFLSRLNFLYTEEETFQTDFRHFWFFNQRFHVIYATVNSTNLEEFHVREIQLPSYPIQNNNYPYMMYPPSGCLLSPYELVVSDGLGNLTRISQDKMGLILRWHTEKFLGGIAFVVLDGTFLVDDMKCLIVLGSFSDSNIEETSKSQTHSLNIFNMDLFEICDDGRTMTLLKRLKCRHPPDLVRFHKDSWGNQFLLIVSKDVCFVDEKITHSTGVLENSIMTSDPSSYYYYYDTLYKDKGFKINSTRQLDFHYTWSQTCEDISITGSCAAFDVTLDDVSVILNPNRIHLSIFESTIWEHLSLYDHIVVDESTWSVDMSRRTTISLFLKKHTHLRWPHLFQSDDGIKEFELVNTQSWSTNSLIMDPLDQIEEIDYHEERVSTYIHAINFLGTIVATHKYTSTEVICQSFNVSNRRVPLLGFQFDVDAVVMTCHTSPNLTEISLQHQSTLCAFSYVQASKRDRKFSYMTTDAMYAFISEYQGHVFIYKQPSPLENHHNFDDGSSSNRLSSHATQEIIISKHPHAEIIGIQSLDERLCVLLTSISIIFFRLS